MLKPGGILLINTCSREQLWKGYWYADLIPEAVERLAAKYMEMAALKTLLGECGFDFRDRFVSLDTVLQSKTYFDPERMLDAETRAGDSTFALLDADQLAQFESQVRAMASDGTLMDYFKEKDLQRSSYGQSLFVYAVRR